MGAIRRSTLGAVVILLLASISIADGPSVRDRIDRIVRTAGLERRELRHVPDLTTEVRALLASDRGEVVAALNEALALAADPSSLASAYQEQLEDLASLFEAEIREPRRPRRILEFGGLIVMWGAVDPVLARMMLQEPALPIESDAPPAALPPERPDVLLEILVAEEEPESWLMDDPVFLETAGLALGGAAQRDEEFANRLLEKFRSASEGVARSVMKIALGRLATEPARAALTAELQAASDLDGSKQTAAYRSTARALRASEGGEGVLGAFRAERIADCPIEARRAFDDAVGGWTGIPPLVKELRENPTEEGIRRLAAMTELPASVTGRAFELLLWRARAAAESGEIGILQELLWPGWRIRSQMAVATEFDPELRGLDIEGLGGYPDPAALCGRLIDDPIIFEEDGTGGPSIYGPTAAGPYEVRPAYVLRDEPEDCFSVTVRRVGDSLRTRVVNTGKERLQLNPAAFRIAVARRVAVRRTSGEAKELRITLGVVAPRNVQVVARERAHVLEPGAGRTFSNPLAAGTPADENIVVEFYDSLGVRAEPSIPIVRAFRGVSPLPPPPEPGPADVEARRLVDRFVFADEQAVLSGEVDLDGDVADLIALGAVPVRRAIRDALDRAWERGSTADRRRDRVEDLARLLADRHRPMSSTWELHVWETRLRVLHGHVVMLARPDLVGECGSGDRRWPEPPAMEDAMGEEPVLRVPLRPDSASLLAAVLKPDETLAMWIRSSEFRASAGLALGAAAEADAALCERILDEFRPGEPGEEETTADHIQWTLAIALGRGGGKDGREALLRNIERAAGLDRAYRLVDALVTAIRAGPAAEEVLVDLLNRMEGRLSAEKYGWLGRSVGGDAVVLNALRYVRKDPTPTALARLARAADGHFSEEPSPSLVLEVIDIALAALDASDPAVREAATNVLQWAIWPSAHFPERSSYSSSWTSPEGKVVPGEAGSMKGRWVGGWPDPVVLAKRLRGYIFEGKVTVPARAEEHESVFTEAPIVDPYRDEEPTVHLDARRVGDRLDLTVENAGDTEVALNPMAMEFATARLSEFTTVRGGVRTVHRELLVRLGSGLRWSPTACVGADDLVVLGPGDTRDFTYPLEPDLPETIRILVEYYDGFGVTGEPPAPRVDHLEATRVE